MSAFSSSFITLRRVRLLHELATQLARLMLVLARTHFMVWEVERMHVGGMLFFAVHRSPYVCVSAFGGIFLT